MIFVHKVSFRLEYTKVEIREWKCLKDRLTKPY